MSKHKISLQARLTLLVLFAVLLFGLSAGYESYKSATHEADEIFDAQLAQIAQSLALLARTFEDEHTDPMPPPIHKYQQSLAFEVWHDEDDDVGQRILLRSNNASEMLPATMPPEGFSNSEGLKARWRYFHLRDSKHGINVLVGQDDKARSELAREVAWHNVIPFLFGLPVLALFTMLAVYLGLQPLRRLAESLHQITPEQLAPVDTQGAPREVVPVINALNSLLERINRTMENERRFTADASHEMRTPIAALKAQVQAAQLSDNKTERMECLANALQGANRMSHLIEQLLTLSKLDETSSLAGAETLNLAGLVQECCAEVGMSALEKNIEIELAAETEPVMAGSADMLHIMLRNLLDNAIRYSPEGGRVLVTLSTASDGRADLEIADSGAGVSDESLAQLGERFNRLGQSGESGVGLGLSIVRRIAEIHHAGVAFSRSAALGGLSVKVSFPPQRAG